MPKKKHKLSKNDRDFIEENFIKLYHDYVSEKQEMEKDIIDSGYSQGYVELAHTQYNGTSVVETKVAQLNKSQRLAFLTTAIHAVDMAYRQCTPEQQKFMDMYYLSRRRYSNAAIREATGKSWKTLGRWRYRICERVARGIGLLD